ncbi:Rieske (2Fe-2S) protein [Burkholderia pseudomallei]|uniref:aromatic ring-hydroxylating oxygenase subunit alpha n=1 Tax=Burkholderia pseudomallei TaxID=28450 RepID=UPI000973BF8C|nr:SRPBCC family protein [Burkholderia pseudomallei]APY98936.1 Rieske (2Fe-2S) protein [Burkholderia pseudomallei]APZ12521.1 Rieske (2Fe-2S) protein [Burkholderia pseudomallei]
MNFDTDLLHRHWHLGCHRRELPNDGDFVRFDTAIGEIVIFNDAGELVAFDNRCPHRGARMYVDDSGNQPASCPYHGWTYREGRLLIPGRKRFDGCALERAKLRTFAVDWCGDFLFFAVHPQTDLYTQLGRFAEAVENISFNIDRRLDLNRYDFECYWPLAIENALEPYHIGAVHPQTLATLGLEDGENVFDGVNCAWYAPVGASRQRNQLARLKRFFNLDYQYEGYASIYLFPFTMISSTYGYSYSLQHFLPAGVGGDRTRFTSRLYAAPAASEQAAQALGAFFESTRDVNRRVFEEDHAICKRMPRNAWSMAPLACAADTEAKIDHFRRACRTFAASRAALPVVDATREAAAG